MDYKMYDLSIPSLFGDRAYIYVIAKNNVQAFQLYCYLIEKGLTELGPIEALHIEESFRKNEWALCGSEGYIESFYCSREIGTSYCHGFNAERKDFIPVNLREWKLSKLDLF